MVWEAVDVDTLEFELLLKWDRGNGKDLTFDKFDNGVLIGRMLKCGVELWVGEEVFDGETIEEGEGEDRECMKELLGV